MRRIAERLMAHEQTQNEPSGTKTLLPVELTLRSALGTLIGRAALRGLLSRSLAAASDEVRWLRAVHVKSDCSLTGLHELQMQLAPELFAEGRTVFLAQMLWFLTAFIGERLTMQLLSETWPKLTLKASDFSGDQK